MLQSGSAATSLRIIMAGVVTLLWSVAVSAQNGPAIAAASDLKFALDEIIASFREKTGHHVRASYGSSGNFYRQIVQDAPFELFLSADEDLVKQLVQQKRTVDEGVLYATGRLVLFVAKGSGIAADAQLADLQRAAGDGRLKKLAIANPEHAPYGRAAREALQSSGIWPQVVSRLVLGENVSQAAQFAISGSAQAGIFAYSLAVAPVFANAGSHVLLPEAMHKPLRQRMVLLPRAGDVARTFYRFLQEPASRLVLTRYGFSLPGETTVQVPR